MASVAERVAEARARLVAAGLSVEDAAFDAELLARHALGWDRATLIIRSREPEPLDFAGAFGALIERRSRRQPVAQLIGHREFWALDFEVTPDVLIPRPETEIVVEEAVALVRQFAATRLVDVGTGSGCIAVALAAELPQIHVLATDASVKALGVARRNAIRHDVVDRVDLVACDVLTGIRARVPLIVSNPPYVPTVEAGQLQPEVLQFEPAGALFGGVDGLDVIRHLFRQATDRLEPGGHLVVEFGFGQAEQVVTLARETGWTIVRLREDLQSIPRTIVLTRQHHG